MKIIRKGKAPDNTLRGACINCDAIVECDRSEAKVCEGDRPFDPSVLYILCPTIGYGNPYLYLKAKGNND